MKTAARFTLPFLFVALVFTASVSPAHAASLTESQIQAIVGLLASFDVPEATISNVQNILHGTAGATAPATSTTQSASTPAASSAGSSASSPQTQTAPSSAPAKTTTSANTSTAASLVLTSADPVLNGAVSVQLTVPRIADNEYAVYTLNPISTVLPSQSGDLFGMPVVFDGHAAAVYTAHMTVTSAHQGTDTVHWFNVLSGAYNLSALLYAQNPFIAGSDMAYASPLPKLLQRIESNIFTIGSSTLPASAVIDQSSLASSSTMPTVTGVALSAKTVTVSVCASGNCTSAAVPVVSGRWSYSVPTSLSYGPHPVQVSAADGTLLTQGTLTVATPVPTCAIKASTPSAVIGQSFLVSWTSTNADSSTGGAGDNRTSGQTSVTPSVAGPYIYNMTFTGRGGQVSCSVTVQVSQSGGYY